MACSPASCYRPTVVVSGKEYTDARCIRFIFGTNVPRWISPNNELSCKYGLGMGRCVLCCGGSATSIGRYTRMTPIIGFGRCSL